jgi:hypothetical protein
VVHDLLLEDGSAVLPVLRVALHEGPAVHIADVGATICSKQIESTDFLLEFLDDLVADELLIGSEDHRIADLLPLLVSLDHAIESWRSPCLSVHVVRTDRIDLDIKGVRGQKLLVDEVAVISNLVLNLVPT